jgi:hypothetical protein
VTIQLPLAEGGEGRGELASAPPDVTIQLPLPDGGEGMRWPPLEPEFVIARGAAARALARSLLATPSRLANLRGLVSGDVLAITGNELPWVDGAEYFGRDGAASWLLVPTTLVQPVPTSWLERRYRAAFPKLDWPCVLIEGSLLPVGGAAPLHAPALESWSALSLTLSPAGRGKPWPRWCGLPRGRCG